ncbi:MAG: hypothetical protein AB1742_05795 [bacterium]
MTPRKHSPLSRAILLAAACAFLPAAPLPFHPAAGFSAGGDGLQPADLDFLDAALRVCSAPLDDFSPLKIGARGFVSTGDPGYRNTIAFLAYSLFNLHALTPAYHAPYRNCIDSLIRRMERPETTEYWRALNLDGDPALNHNLMYRAHLSLMYGLFQFVFGDARHEESFKRVTAGIYEEVKQSPAGAVNSIPEHVFVHPLAVAMLSFFVHDSLFGTNYSDVNDAVMEWIDANATRAGTLLLDADRDAPPCRTAPLDAIPGFSNALSIVFLDGIPDLRDHALKMYRQFRDAFVVEADPVTYVRGSPGEGICHVSTLFGVLAARAMGDEETFERLSRSRNAVLASLIEASKTQGDAAPLTPGEPLLRVLLSSFDSFIGWHEIIQRRAAQTPGQPYLGEIAGATSRVLDAAYVPPEKILRVRLVLERGTDLTILNVAPGAVYETWLDETHASFSVRSETLVVPVPAGTHTLLIRFTE